MKKKKIKISPTLLNEWASLLNGDYDKWGKDENAIREYILGEYKPNYATSKGSAVHAMIEHGTRKYAHIEPAGRLDLDSDGDTWISYDESTECIIHEPEFNHKWIFTNLAANVIEQVHKEMKHGTFEVWNHYEFELRGFTIRMNMRHDQLDGLTINEFKTSKRAKKYSDYADSYQLKAYLLGCPDAIKCVYHALQVPDENRKGVIAWARYQRFEYLRTGAEEQQVRQMASGLLDFILDDDRLLDKLTIN